MDALKTFTTSGVAFLLTLAFGFWLSKSGKPYNGFLFNTHKLIALGTVVITAMQVYTIPANSESQMLILLLIIVTGICVVALFASGAFMSIGNLNYVAMLTTHRAALILGSSAMTLMLYLSSRINS